MRSEPADTQFHDVVEEEEEETPGDPTASKGDDDGGGAGDGWDDDDDDLDFIDADQGPEEQGRGRDVETRAAEPAPPTSCPPPPPSPPPPIPPPHRQQQQHRDDDPRYNKIRNDLGAYVSALPHVGRSIQTLLEAEYNDAPNKVHDLLAYYSDRPALTQYTIDKELPRMDYALHIHPPDATSEEDVLVVESKDEIARHLARIVEGESERRLPFVPPATLLTRCANQSLLADLLQACTGPDGLIRPQYASTAVADACRFELHLHPDRAAVQARAHLSLSLPTLAGADRWTVADIWAGALLVIQPNAPYLEYRIEDVQPATGPDHPEWQTKLEQASEMICELHAPGEEGDWEGQPTQRQTSSNFRDAFLEQSQAWFQKSAAFHQGMQSAWKEIEAVAPKLPAFISDDLLKQAAAEEEAHLLEQQQRRRQQEMQQQQHHTSSSSSTSQPQQEHRPTSILGGLVRSGLSRLAQSVALPEEDLTIYAEYASPPVSGPLSSTGSFPRPSDYQETRQTQQKSAAVQPSQEGYQEHAPIRVPQTPVPVPSPKTASAPPGSAVSESPKASTKARGDETVSSTARGAEIISQAPPSLEGEHSQSVTAPGVLAAMQANGSLADVRDGWDDSDEDLDEIVADAPDPPAQETSVVKAGGVGDGTIATTDARGNKEPTRSIPSPPSSIVKPTSASSSDEPGRIDEAAPGSPGERDPAKPKSRYLLDELSIAEGWVYDPATDIVPTRKRWVNPKPGLRALRQ